jgi:2,3-bisphosphoglycerate-dependent phosphoglycerate mutase
MAGQGNYPLTELGREQAKDTGKFLRDYRFDRVFVSDLDRAQETARIILSINRYRDTELELCEELRERSGGTVEGMPYPSIRKIMPPTKYKLWQRDYFEAPPYGESLSDVADRVLPFMRENVYPLIKDGQTVVVVSHAGTMRTIIGDISRCDEDQIMKLNVDNGIPYFFYGTPPL